MASSSRIATSLPPAAELIDDTAQRKRLGVAALRYVEENVSFDKMSDVMNDGFRKALALRK